MRKLSLRTYNTYSLKRMSCCHSLSLKKLLKEYETQNSRLFAPLLCWCYLNEKDVNNNTQLSYHLEMLNNMYPQVSEDNLLLYLQNCDDKECQKYYHSFMSENMRRNETEKKNTYRRRIIKKKRELNLSDYQLCKLAKVNSGNFNAFFYKQDNNKLSLKKCRELMWVLKEYS